jgi:adenine-specific DNA methylase
MSDFPRLIEHAFPLKQASLDSVHEKNIRHGHISTLHIWPARRPLAACRATLIASLLPDPGNPAARTTLCERIGGTVKRTAGPDGRVKEETEGGVLRWKREVENAEALDGLRREILEACGGRAPRVLDPFGGGGAIPLEAMRLGCEATAVDFNPVAWFVLKCTLEYPQRLAGQSRPLPDFILQDDDFMRTFFNKAKGYGRAEVAAAMGRLGKRRGPRRRPGRAVREGTLPFAAPEEFTGSDLFAGPSWHIRAWVRWVLDRARGDLAPRYPLYAEFEPVKPGLKSYESRPPKRVPVRADGHPDLDALNEEFSAEYLEDSRNPRWVPKPTLAYLWARTVTCKSCRATIPLLKTRWLCKTDSARVLLIFEPNPDRTGVVFGVQSGVPAVGGNAAQRRAHDKRIGAGTMSRRGATCPCCKLPSMTMEDIRLDGRAAGLGTVMTAVMVEGRLAREYRLPTPDELRAAEDAASDITRVFEEVPFGAPNEPIASKDGLGIRVPLYGLDRWDKLYLPRQLVALGTFVKHTRAAREMMRQMSYSTEWIEALCGYLAMAFDRLADRCSTLCQPDPSPAQSGVMHTFSRFALPMNWDFIEGVPTSDVSGGYLGSSEWIAKVVESVDQFVGASAPTIVRGSSVPPRDSEPYDLVLTDPPYYDAISYSDLMDFFYIWLRRILHGLSPEIDAAFRERLAPKWDAEAGDGELIDDASRHGGDAARSKAAYEDGMYRVFQNCHRLLRPEGRLVIVFANKRPDAWETLVSAIIRAGFVVDGSWPIQTERGNRTRALSSAALASSVWLVCKKRPVTARPGWDAAVLEEMRERIAERLRRYWDDGIRGPDFVWAATGPALEAFSRHPVVKRADGEGVMPVGEFLEHARRMVVDYVVGQVLSGGKAREGDTAAAERLDEPTAYYLLHRHAFGLEEAPVGAVILYATACGLTDAELTGTWDLLAIGKQRPPEDEDEQEDDEEVEDGDEDGGESSAKVKLKTWAQRRGRSLGLEAPGGRPVPLIDRVHRLMYLWKAGDPKKLDDYLDDNGLRRHELFKRVLQSLLELSERDSEERSLLERISKHVGALGVRTDADQGELAFDRD